LQRNVCADYRGRRVLRLSRRLAANRRPPQVLSKVPLIKTIICGNMACTRRRLIEILMGKEALDNKQRQLWSEASSPVRV
jgi:hypothetical protein